MMEVEAQALTRTKSANGGLKKRESIFDNYKLLDRVSMEELFQSLDSDQDGNVSFEEFARFYEVMHRNMEEEHLHTLENHHKIHEAKMRARLFKYFMIFFMIAFSVILLANIGTASAAVAMQKDSYVTQESAGAVITDGMGHALQCASYDMRFKLNTPALFGTSAAVVGQALTASAPPSPPLDDDENDEEEVTKTDVMVHRENSEPISTALTTYHTQGDVLRLLDDYVTLAHLDSLTSVRLEAQYPGGPERSYAVNGASLATLGQEKMIVLTSPSFGGVYLVLTRASKTLNRRLSILSMEKAADLSESDWSLPLKTNITKYTNVEEEVINATVIQEAWDKGIGLFGMPSGRRLEERAEQVEHHSRLERRLSTNQQGNGNAQITCTSNNCPAACEDHPKGLNTEGYATCADMDAAGKLEDRCTFPCKVPDIPGAYNTEDRLGCWKAKNRKKWKDKTKPQDETMHPDFAFPRAANRCMATCTAKNYGSMCIQGDPANTFPCTKTLPESQASFKLFNRDKLEITPSGLSAGRCQYVKFTPYGSKANTAPTFTCKATASGTFALTDWSGTSSPVVFDFNSCFETMKLETGNVVTSGTTLKTYLQGANTGVCGVHWKKNSAVTCPGTYKMQLCGPMTTTDTNHPAIMCGDPVGCVNFDGFGFGVIGGDFSLPKMFDFNAVDAITGQCPGYPYMG